MKAKKPTARSSQLLLSVTRAATLTAVLVAACACTVKYVPLPIRLAVPPVLFITVTAVILGELYER